VPPQTSLAAKNKQQASSRIVFPVSWRTFFNVLIEPGLVLASRGEMSAPARASLHQFAKKQWAGIAAGPLLSDLPTFRR